MKKLNSFKDSVPFKNLLECVPDINKQQFINWLEFIPNNLKPSRTKILTRIIKTNGWETSLELYDEYFATYSKIRRIEILSGKDAKIEYRHKLKSRPRPENFSVLQKDYWVVRRGFSETEAENMVAGYQSDNQKRRSPSSYMDTNKKLRFCIEYWTNLGYTREEAELLRKQYLVLNDKESMIQRHGDSEGLRLYNHRVDKFKESSKRNWKNRKSAGYVSKESKLFFVQLYKFCRKLGIQRKDIYVGIAGAKEFFIRRPAEENSGRFFDFAIPKLNIVVEYNGVFWHPRKEEEWRNPWISFDDAMILEREREELCAGRGYNLFTVWSDDDKIDKLHMLQEEIRSRMDVY